MKKKLLSALCAAVLVISCAAPSAGALEGEQTRRGEALSLLGLVQPDAGGLRQEAPLTRVQAAVLLVRLAGGEKEPDTDGWFAGFRDVPAWAAPAVNYAVRRGWLTGVSNVRFDPQGAVSADEWCAMLLRMLGYRPEEDFDAAEAAAAAWRLGVGSRVYTGSLTRGDAFESMYDALSAAYPGTKETVLSRLTAAGAVSSAAAGALGLRDPALTARQTADRYLSACFVLTLYESAEEAAAGEASADASGFFISADGLAVTNYHSIDGAVEAAAALYNGETYPVERVVWYDPDADIAVIRVSNTGSGGKTVTFHPLTVVGSAELRPGDTVYAIGSPLGLGLAISAGIVAATGHQVERYSQPCIVNSADISQGSSGGALLNVYGQVVGITSGAYVYGNSMYLAVPAEPVLTADLTAPGWTLAEVAVREADRPARD